MKFFFFFFDKVINKTSKKVISTKPWTFVLHWNESLIFHKHRDSEAFRGEAGLENAWTDLKLLFQFLQEIDAFHLGN